jgi:hypothetical protein
MARKRKQPAYESRAKVTKVMSEGTGVHAIDLETREMRTLRKEGVALMAQACDALPWIAFSWPLVSAQVGDLTAPLHQCHAGLTGMLKHVCRGDDGSSRVGALRRRDGKGGRWERRGALPRSSHLRERLHHCPIVPGRYQHRYGADPRGSEHPLSCIAMPTMASAVRITPLGAPMLDDAEVVSGRVLIQLAHPGAPVSPILAAAERGAEGSGWGEG